MTMSSQLGRGRELCLLPPTGQSRVTSATKRLMPSIAAPFFHVSLCPPPTVSSSLRVDRLAPCSAAIICGGTWTQIKEINEFDSNQLENSYLVIRGSRDEEDGQRGRQGRNRRQGLPARLEARLEVWVHRPRGEDLVHHVPY